MSNDDEQLRADLLEAKRALMAARAELLKSQIVAATRLDVIRLLGYISNRQQIPELSTLLPEQFELRAAFAAELRDLADDLRTRADGYDKIAETLEEGHRGNA